MTTVAAEVAEIVKSRNLYPNGCVPIGLLVAADLEAKSRLRFGYDDLQMTEEQRDLLRKELIRMIEADAWLSRQGVRP